MGGKEVVKDQKMGNVTQSKKISLYITKTHCRRKINVVLELKKCQSRYAKSK